MVKKSITISVACLAVFTGVLWYEVYLPLSPKLGGPSLKAFPFVLRFAGLAANIGNKLGIGSTLVLNRAILDGFSWIDENLLSFGQDEWKNGIDIKDMVIAGVPVIIFRPDASTIQHPAPSAVIYFHGGGLALLSPKYKSYKVICIMIAKQTKSVVISVDYRLAPEHVFPAQFNDCFAVVSAVMSEPTKFGVDGNKIALAGDSAGGLLSAAISLEFAKLANAPSKIAAQVLIYPWLQSIDVVCLPSYKAYRKGFTLSDGGMAVFGSAAAMGNIDMVPEYLVGNVSQYFMQTPLWKYLEELSSCKPPSVKSAVDLPSSFVDKVTDPRLSPLLADDVSRSPPTILVLPEYDVLANEGKLYAKRLELAGVHVSKKEYETYHGFVQNVGLSIPNADRMGKIAINDIANFLNSVFYNID